jgi:hypothetical protein
LSGWHADLIGVIPIPVRAIEYHPEILLTAGSIYCTTGINNTATHRGTHFVSRFGLGLQALAFERVGLRVLWRWENTAKLKNPQYPQQIFNNAHSLALGVFMTF